MAKRHKSATVQLKLRIREELRQKLEREARRKDVSLNSEMARRLEDSFDGTSDVIIRLLTGGSPMIGELLPVIADTLKEAELQLKLGPDRWGITGEALKKVVEFYFAEPSAAEFPGRAQAKGADGIAYTVLDRARRLAGQWDYDDAMGLSGGEDE